MSDESLALARARARALANAKSRPTSSGRSDDVNAKHCDARLELEAQRAAWKAKQLERRSNSNSCSNDVSSDIVLSEEDQLIARGHQLQSENRFALNNSIRMAKEATEIGNETLNKLEQQREQFQRMDANLDATNDSLSRSDRLIRGMRSWGGMLANAFSSSKTKKHNDQLKINQQTAQTQVTPQSTQKTLDSSLKTQSAATLDLGQINISTERALAAAHIDDSQYTATRSDKQSSALKEFEANHRAEDQQLDELSGILEQMKVQAHSMNKELKLHDQYINHIGNKLDTTGDRVKEANRKIKKIT